MRTHPLWTVAPLAVAFALAGLGPSPPSRPLASTLPDRPPDGPARSAGPSGEGDAAAAPRGQ